MKILYCTGRFDTYGAAHSAQNEILGFLEAGDVVHVISYSKVLPELLASHERCSITFISEPFSLFSTALFIVQVIKATRKFASWDIVYINALEYALVPYWSYEKLVYYARTTLAGVIQAEKRRGWRSSLKKQIFRKILQNFEIRLIKRAALVLCKSRMMAEEIEKFYERQESISVIVGGCPQIKKSIHSVREEKILFASRLTPTKAIVNGEQFTYTV